MDADASAGTIGCHRPLPPAAEARKTQAILTKPDVPMRPLRIITRTQTIGPSRTACANSRAFEAA